MNKKFKKNFQLNIIYGNSDSTSDSTIINNVIKLNKKVIKRLE